MSEDPIGLAGGINPYSFASNDAVNGADASGLEGDLLVRCSSDPWYIWFEDDPTRYLLGYSWRCTTVGSAETRGAGLIAATNPYAAAGLGYSGSGGSLVGGGGGGGRDVGKYAQRKCAGKAFIWAATAAADALGVAELYRGAAAVWRFASLARVNARIFARAGALPRIIAQNTADAVSHGVASAQSFGIGAATTDVPLMVAEKGAGITVGDVLLAFVPFASFTRQLNEMAAACDPQ